MLSSRKNTVNKNEKDDKKIAVKQNKSSAVENDKTINSKKMEKKIKPSIDNEKETKPVASSSKKNITLAKPNSSSEKVIQNKTKALKGNHQIITSPRAPINKKRIESSQTKNILSKKIVSNTQGKSIVSKNSSIDSNKGYVNKKPLTSITINSPKQKRKEFQLDATQENMVEAKHFGELNNERVTKATAVSKNKNNEFDIALNNHKRYRTRTLEPEEIKVIDKLVRNIEYTDHNISESKAERKLVAQPKSFFVSLNEDNKNLSNEEKPSSAHSLHSKENDEEENDEVSYEDDFDSYESDFESYNSSDKSTKVSDSEVDEISSTTSGLSSLNNINQFKTKDDKTLDSGNYELAESQKSSDIRYDKSLEKIEESINSLTSNIKTEYVPQSLASLTDEGFDENSGGQLNSISNISVSTKVEDKIYQPSMKTDSIVKIDSKSNYSQRAHDLKGLIVLDHVKYFLFEMFPMSYDTFITIHGKSNMTQVMCQTNDDYIEDEVQTDLIQVENKWTQHPIEFSKNDITYDSNKDRELKNSKKEKVSDLDIYLNQKSGCGTDNLYANSILNNKSLIAHRSSFIKLTKFIDKTGKCILNYLEDFQRSFNEDVVLLKKDPNDEKFSYNNREKYLYEIIKQRPLNKIQFTNSDPNIILTIHPVVKENKSEDINNISLFSIICIWSLKGSLLKPLKMLGSIGNIKCCEISKGLSGIVVAGLDDGNISAWNLKDENIWFENAFCNLRGSSAAENETLKLCSFHSGYDIYKSQSQHRYLWGSSIEVLFSKSIYKNDSVSKDGTNQQVYLLQEYGFLSIWIVTHKLPAYKNVSYADTYHSQWSTISLVKTNVVNLNLQNNGFRSILLGKKNKQTPSNSRATSSKSSRVESGRTKKGIVRAFGEDELDFDLDELLPGKYGIDDEKIEKIEENLEDTKFNLVCTMMKEHRFTGDILIGCGNCQILNYSPKSIKRNVDSYKCEDAGSCVTCIETPSSNLPFFFSSCSNYIVHLYSKKSSRPLRSFFYAQNDADIQAYKQFTLSYDFYNFSNSNSTSVKRLRNNFWLDWCELNAHMFFTFFADGTIALWDLFSSDVSPKLYFNYLINNDTREKRFLINGKILPIGHNQPGSVKYSMILHLSDGQIQLHILDEKHFKTRFASAEEELHLLKTYFEFL